MLTDFPVTLVMPEKSIQTLLAFDFGMKHIGVAIGQSITKTASSLMTLSAQNGIPKWEQVEALIHQWRPQALIVGLPLNMDGSDQPITLCVRKFINRLKAKYKLPVFEVDERLTTWEANQRITGLKAKKIRTVNETHTIAAVILIEQWMNEH